MKAPVKQVVAVVTREITVRSAENILDLIETDQTDPAGRWRLRLDGDKIYFDRATAADWSTYETWLTYDKANEKLTLGKKLDANALKITGLAAPTAQDDALRKGRAEIASADIAAAAGILLSQLEAAVCSETEAATIADGKITTHKGDASAHHTATTRLDSAVVGETRDMTAVSGDVSYTGYGFQPRALIALACVADTIAVSWGIADIAPDEAAISLYGANTAYRKNDYLVLAYETTTKYQAAVVKTMDADGFTLTWSKGGTPSAGTLDFIILALR